MKLYHQTGIFNISKILKEALIQATLSSAFTCDFSIHSGSRGLFEVRLVMGRLEGDLEADIKHRALQENHIERPS